MPRPEKRAMKTINKDISVDSLLKTDLHMHTTWCDGKNTPEEMILSAIDKGMECIGFSGHSFVELDPGCGMSDRTAVCYREDIRGLKEKYKNDIRIFCGIEQDYYSETDMAEYEYIIGSVHYIGRAGQMFAIDDTPDIFREGVERIFDNDFYSAAESYYETVADVVRKTGADIIGHFDLISKFNEKEHLFDEHHPRYTAAWKQAVDRLLPEGKLFEINTGAVSRGWRSVPYPLPDMIAYIKKKNGKFILSSDSHSKETIGYGFEKTAELL